MEGLHDGVVDTFIALILITFELAFSSRFYRIDTT